MSARMKSIVPQPVKLSAWVILLAGGIMAAAAQTTNNYNFTFATNLSVPDGNPNGLLLSANLTGLSGSINKLTVSLDITGGFNGDLYGYLSGPDSGFAVLLNRSGATSGEAFGYDDTGFNITFDDSADYGNIHYYQGAVYNLNGSGQLTGIWSSDGRAIDPQSAPSVFETTQPSALLSSFDGTNPDGTWTLFLADLSSGGQSTIENWGLNIETVPEPSVGALLGIGILLTIIKRITR